MNLTPGEIARYQRHLSLEGFGIEAQLKLKAAHVLVIGAGGLGCPVLLYLAAAGVGHITLIDSDKVDVSNLQRQIIYLESDQGSLKAEVAAQRLRALNPSIEVTALAELFSRENALALVRQATVVVDGSDNFSTRYLVNDACVMENRPLVYGAIQGFEGQVSVFNWKGGPTYRCLFPEPPPAGSVPNCAEGGVLGVLPGLIGTMQASEAIKIITGIGEPLSGRLLLWDALSMTSQILKLTPDPQSRKIVELPPAGYGETCIVPSSAPEVECSALFSPENPTPQLLDVREKWERDQGAILPSTHISLPDLESGAGSALIKEMDPARATVVYCATGRRSLRGAEILRQKYHFNTAVSLKGGYKNWSALASLGKTAS